MTNTAVGYAGGYTPNPTYEEVCSARTGHTEIVKVSYDPAKVELRAAAQDLLREPRPDPGHAPGQRRGHPVPLGDLRHHTTSSWPRRSGSATTFQTEFGRAGYGRITTEIKPAPDFYYAEDYHQQYLDKNPRGYCPIHATGVTCNVA